MSVRKRAPDWVAGRPYEQGEEVIGLRAGVLETTAILIRKVIFEQEGV